MVVDLRGVESVTGLNTDNSDPYNPIVRVSVDGVKLTGLGTPGSPLSVAGFVESVTGLNTDNGDPTNPVVRLSTDGVTITGAGTPGDPLVAAAGTGQQVFLDLGTGTTFNCDWSVASWFRITPSGAFSVTFSNTPDADRAGTIVIELVGADGYVLTLPASGTWGALGAPEFSPNTDLITVGMRNAEPESYWMLAFPGTL